MTATSFTNNGIAYHLLTQTSGMRDGDEVVIKPDPRNKPKGGEQTLTDPWERVRGVKVQRGGSKA